MITLPLSRSTPGTEIAYTNPTSSYLTSPTLYLIIITIYSTILINNDNSFLI